jgi:hypothetical protein
MRITEEGEPVLQISLRDCGVTPKDADFQPHNPSGIYDLDMFFMRSRNIVQALMTEELSGRGHFVADSVKRIFLSDTGMEETTDFVLDVFGGQDIPDSGWLTFEFKGCLSSRYHNDVWLLTDRSMMAIQQVFTDPKATHSTRCSILDQYFCGKTKVIFKQAVKILSWAKFASSTEVSTSGVPFHPVQAPELDTTGIVVSVTRTLDTAHRRIDYVQKILPAHERIDYIEKILPALNSRRRDLRLFDVLEEWEKQEAYTRLRMLPPRRQVSRTLNSTGYYRFNLRQLDIRDSCIDLVSMTGNDLKNALACFRDFGLGHKGGPRSRVDLVRGITISFLFFLCWCSVRAPKPRWERSFDCKHFVLCRYRHKTKCSQSKLCPNLACTDIRPMLRTDIRQDACNRNSVPTWQYVGIGLSTFHVAGVAECSVLWKNIVGGERNQHQTIFSAFSWFS